MTPSRYILSWIAQLTFALSVVLFAKAGINYYRDSMTVSTRCEIVKHHVNPSVMTCLYPLNTYRGVFGVCHVVHEWTKPNGDTTTWCQGRLISSCYSSHDEAWQDMLNYPLGKVYPCYYWRDEVKLSFDERYEWRSSLIVGAVSLFISIVSAIALRTSRPKAKVE